MALKLFNPTKEFKVFFTYGSLRPDCCCWDGLYDVPELKILYGQATIHYSKLFIGEDKWPVLDYNPDQYSYSDYVCGYWLQVQNIRYQEFFETLMDQIEDYPYDYQKIIVPIIKFESQKETECQAIIYFKENKAKFQTPMKNNCCKDYLLERYKLQDINFLQNSKEDDQLERCF